MLDNNILNALGLSEYYPNKLGREEVYTLSQYSLSNTTSQATQDLPFYFLANLLALNYQARWLKVEYQREESDDDDDIWNEDESNIEPTTQQVHPLDVIIATLLCCHPIIHQDLVVKLWECKLAIPLVVQESQEHPPKFFLWAMRALVMRWKRTQGQELRSEERAIADYPMQTISFIRLDRSEISKSALLNTVIFGSNPHDVFFHRDSEGSNHYRQLAEGSIELAWHLPEGDFLTNTGTQNNFQLDNITAFANLRGDARQYPQQLELIKHISSYIFLFVSAKELQSSVSIIKKFLSAGKAVILLLTNKSIEPIDNQSIKDWIENFKTENKLKQISFIKLSGKSIPEIREKIRQQLTRLNPIIDKPEISLESLAEIMSQEGMDIDEYDDDCQQGIQQANKILEIVRQYPPDERKAKLLPLQNKLWKDWADADKEMVRQQRKTSTESSGEYAKKQYNRRACSRKEQIQLVQQDNLPFIIVFFCKKLLQNRAQTNEYFIRQLKLQLDALSRVELPELYSAYGEKMRLLGEYPAIPISNEFNVSQADSQEQELHTRNAINQELQLIDAEITSQSFGLEHLLREIGQIYLALKSIEAYGENPKHKFHRTKEQEEWYQELPNIVAKLLLYGYPLEIMDGEVSSVPLAWVQAVLQAFTQLVKRKLNKDNPSIFALSAMGIQSSGKSTLLNVMFGLQFAVSAGRCTKGIFLQPVKLSESLQEKLKVDYIFVIDTEGIKSSEQSLDPDTLHDNELSTFVIGLSDLTLIKVSGENSEYLKDILPISVQAFLRMRQVSLKPKTKIIHRNVDTSSSEKLNKQNVHLNNTLDKYTALACREERQPIQPFRNIINFDLRKDVEYLGTLYKGTSGRNPIDPDYSKNVKEITNEIIDEITQVSISSINKFTEHIENLWDAVKKDDFVYEFKNTIQIQARGILDRFWSEIIQASDEDIAKLVSLSYREIRSCRSELDVDNVTSKYKRELSSLAQQILKSNNEKIEDFFKAQDGHYENAMKKWEASTINSFEEWLDNKKRTSIQQIESYHDSRLAALKRMKKSVGYKEVFTKRITAYVKQKKQNKGAEILINLQETELRHEFDSLWEDLLKEIKSPTFKSENVVLDIESILSVRYRKTFSSITQRKGRKVLQDCHIEEFKISNEYYRELGIQGFINTLNRKDILEIEEQINRLKNNLLKELYEKLDRAERKLTPYNQNLSMFSKFLVRVDEQFLKTSEDARGVLKILGFILTRECKSDLFMIISGEAIRRLEKIHKLWREEQDPVLTMDKERESYWQLFLTMFQSANLQQATIAILKEIIEEGISQNIENELPNWILNIRQELKYNKFFRTKQSLIAGIMIDLSEKDNFEDYLEYIRYPKTAFKKWFAQHIDHYNRDGKIRRIVETEIDTSVQQAISIIQKTNASIFDSSDKSYSILNWLDKFLELDGSNLISENIERIERLAEQFPKEDFIFPDNEIHENLQEVKNNLLTSVLLSQLSKATSEKYQKIRNQVVQKIFDDNLQCVESCPFCGEICMLGAKHKSDILHVSFKNIHRPQGLTGFSDDQTNRLNIESCSELIAGNYRFKNYDTNGEWKNYKSYRDIYPTWDIKGDFSLEVEDYWKWVMYKYNSEFAKQYSAKEADIPEAWKMITKEQATENLRQIIDGQL
ncbi:hypothetical protein Lepto7376_3822 [[Leptolyngbya] sp. PCC 7376]|nr:hypothetical protein Lepto7376_3822 [[Leptolyngbya] sp. PCC 7376]